MLSVRCLICFNKRVDDLVAEAIKKTLRTEDGRPNEEKLTEEAVEKVTLEDGFQISNKLIAKNEVEELQMVGAEMGAHFQAHHPEELIKIARAQAEWNGFNLMKFFETENSESRFEKEKEAGREKFLEMIMYGAPEIEEEEDEEEDEDMFEDDDEEEESEPVELVKQSSEVK